MHFIVEITVCGGYSSRIVHQLVSAVITRAIGTFSARGIDPQRYDLMLCIFSQLSFSFLFKYLNHRIFISALPEDEWFVDTAKTAISKLMQGTSESEISDPDEHISIMHHDISDSDGSLSSPSISESLDSFASANMGGTDSPVYFTDPET